MMKERNKRLEKIALSFYIAAFACIPMMLLSLPYAIYTGIELWWGFGAVGVLCAMIGMSIFIFLLFKE